jgi:hypothetical protein
MRSICKMTAIRVAMLAALVLCLMLAVMPAASADAFSDELAKLELNVCYAHSVDTGEDTTGFLCQYPLEIKMGEAFKPNVDLLIFPKGIDDGGFADIGIGMSVSVTSVSSRLSVGVGYVPEGLGISGYISVKLL